MIIKDNYIINNGKKNTIIKEYYCNLSLINLKIINLNYD